jgi:hypothetical protein
MPSADRTRQALETVRIGEHAIVECTSTAAASASTADADADRCELDLAAGWTACLLLPPPAGLPPSTGTEGLAG